MPARKKDSSTRVRGDRASTAASLTSSTRPAPDLPESIDWHPAVVAWWVALWAAPMSSEFHASDVHQLFLLADLYQAYYLLEPDQVSPKLKLAGEIRLQRQAFGMTPYDRRRLEWTIATAEDATDRRSSRRSTAVTPPPAAAADPRAALRAV